MSSTANQYSRNKLIFALLAALILLLAVYCRIWHLQFESLDGDELFSRRVALASSTAALDLIRDDLMHPPLYYFTLKAVMPLTGSDAIGIRTLSLACGVASIAALLLWSLLVPGWRRGIYLAAGLIAFNITDIFYSQQARSYALYSLWICLLTLWALALERYARQLWYWAAGTLLMMLAVYTHYVAALFIAVIVFATVLSQGVPGVAKFRMAIAAGIAALSFVPWLIWEAPVFRAKHGVGGNIEWQGLPTGYDLRSIWADFIGLPAIHGGTTLALAIGMLLAGFAVFRSFKSNSAITSRAAGLLLATAVLPPLLLFATSFKPLGLTVFGERHLLPSIFATVVLMAVGAESLSSVLPKPHFVWLCVAVSLFALQWSATARLLAGPDRQPYAEIATDLTHIADRREPVYTTWPYGIGETVNFYLHTDRVQPLPALSPMPSVMPKEFVVLYRPAVKKEQQDLDAFLEETPGASLNHCNYYSAAASEFGTRLCTVQTKIN